MAKKIKTQSAPVVIISLGRWPSLRSAAAPTAAPRPVVGSVELNNRINASLALIAARQGYGRVAGYFATLGK